MRKQALYLIIPLLLVFSNLNAINQPRVDSLFNALATSPKDSNYVEYLFSLAGEFYQEDLDSAFSFCQEAQLVSIQINYIDGIASSHNWMGYMLYHNGDIQGAIEQFELSLEANEKTNDSLARGNMLNNLGFMYKEAGDIEKALHYLHEGLEIRKNIHHKEGVGTTLNNIGLIYKELQEYKTALKYLQESLEYRVETKDTNGQSTTLNNIAVIHEELGEMELAKTYLKKAMIQSKLNPNIAHKAMLLNNLAKVFMTEKKYDSAAYYLDSSLVTSRSINNLLWEASALYNYAKLYRKQSNWTEAKKYALEAYAIASKTEYADRIRDCAEQLYLIYNHENDSKNALKYLQEYVLMKDSLNNVALQEAAYKKEVNYEFEKKAQELEKQQAIEKAVLLKDKEKNEALNKKEQQEKNVIIGFVSAIGALVLIFAVFIFSRLRITSRQKNIIEKQKKQVDHAYSELEVKNEEIMDSITYAKRIQSAILPPNKIVKTYLQDSFILYKPKDIVAGDFYWMETKENKVLFAAADCTGHGVPGAMVSVICNNGLNRSVREHNLTDPGKILDKTREIVVDEFAKSEEEVKDGMDIALCSLDGYTLQYAGAHNPLWIIRDGELIEIKADKQPIGKFDNPTDYNTHTINLVKGDTIYIASDGYVDQFGGEKGKKFKARPLKDLLISIQDKSMEEQKSFIDQIFEDWKGDLEQVDDVCLIGVRV